MRIDLIVPDPAERAAALTALAPRLPLEERDSFGAEHGDADVVWIHGPAIGGRWLDEEALAALRAFVGSGGRVVLSAGAAALAPALTGEPVAPTLRDELWPQAVGELERHGVMPLPGHPLFDRAPGGCYLVRPTAGARRSEAVWDGARPRTGAVAAVAKVHLGCEPERAVLVDFPVGGGRVLALGAPLSFVPAGSHDPFVEERLRFCGDLVDYAMDDDAAEGAPCWPLPGERVVVAAASLRRRAIDRPAALPSLEHPVPAAADAFFDLVSADGHFALGTTRAGLRELWRGGLRAFRDVEVALAVDGGWQPAAELLADCVLAPERLERTLAGGGARVAELTAFGAGGLVTAWRNDGPAAVQLRITGVCDHRLIWPHPAGALGDLRAGTAAGGRELRVEAAVAGYCATLRSEPAPLRAVLCDASTPIVGAEGGAAVAFERVLEIQAGETACVELGAATPAGLPAPGGPASLDGQLEIAIDGDGLDSSLRWVRAKTRDFRMPFDEASAGLVAGYGFTRPGWFAGRPGYAWFFGRDSLECSQALLAFGDRAAVLDNLRLLARFQHPGGKIHHELTPTGVAHYDAADSTPMFIDGVARYLAWTADEAATAELWPAVERALEHLAAADRDGDGIMENRDNGHGWIEGGPLGADVQLEVYQLAWVWRAFAAGASLARALGHDRRARACDDSADRSRDRLAEFEAGTGFAHALRRDGTRCEDPSVTTVTPALLDMVDRTHAAAALWPFAAGRHAADWGVRMLPNDHPAYDPASYQAGSAWPLFTGWVALADFHAGRPDQAWARVAGLLATVWTGAPGVVDEVLRGDRPEGRGICPHQAWSHTAILGSVACGLLGLCCRTDGEIALEPSLPGALDRVAFRRLRIRGATLDGSIERDRDGMTVALTHEGEPLELEVAPFVHAPATVGGVTRDGSPLDFHREDAGDGFRLRARIRIDGPVELRFAAAPALLVGGSTDARLLGRRFPEGPDGAVVELCFDGTGGAAVPVRLAVPPRGVDGAELDGSALRLQGDVATVRLGG